MVVKLIHCSDLHLDSALRSNLSREKAKIRNTELCAAFGRMVAFAKQERVTAVLIAGDLFDSSYVSRQTVDYVLEVIRDASRIQFFYLHGNHDGSKAVFADFDLPDNLNTFNSQWNSYQFEQVTITAMEPEESDWLTMYDRLQLDGEALNIVMLHGQIAAQPGAEQIALPMLRGKHIRYLALGHLHAYSKAPLDMDGEYCYAGCLEGRGFDECGEKGFVLLETDGFRLQSRFVPFAARTLHEVSADLTEQNTVTQILSKMKQAAAGIAPQDLVKFTLTGTYTLQTQKDLCFLQQMLEPDFWFVKIKDETHLHVDKTSFEYDLSLKGEFVRSVLASAYNEEEKTHIISCGIRALSGEEVLR